MVQKVENPGRTVKYMLKDDRESDAPTHFILRPLTWEEHSEVVEDSPFTPQQAIEISAVTETARSEKRELTAEEVARVNEIVPNNMAYLRRLTKQMALAVRYGVTKIENLQDFDGNPVKMGGAEFARYGSPEAIRELGDEILRISRLPEGAAKN